jgi:hypothetical protein
MADMAVADLQAAVANLKVFELEGLYKKSYHQGKMLSARFELAIFRVSGDRPFTV